jgi:predicted kinase
MGPEMKEVVILVGRQGAGKTRYCLTSLLHHTRICQDEGPRDFERLFRRYERALEAGVERIVIDRTNPTSQRRTLFADAARARGYRVRIVYFDVPRELCERRITGRGNHPTLTLDKMHQAINAYESRLIVPTEDECDELVIIRQRGEDA